MSDKTKETGNNTTPYDPFNVTNLSTNQGSVFCNLKPEMENDEIEALHWAVGQFHQNTLDVVLEAVQKNFTIRNLDDVIMTHMIS